MALCSYDNELNTKYKYLKDLDMARQSAAVAQKKTAEAKEAEVKEALAEVQESVDQEVNTQTQEVKDEVVETQVDQEETMSIIEAMALAEKGKKVRRIGWNSELSKHFVTIIRGQTKPVLSSGKHSSPYTPSIVDVMIEDWVEV